MTHEANHLDGLLRTIEEDYSFHDRFQQYQNDRGSSSLPSREYDVVVKTEAEMNESRNDQLKTSTTSIYLNLNQKPGHLDQFIECIPMEAAMASDETVITSNVNSSNNQKGNDKINPANTAEPGEIIPIEMTSMAESPANSKTPRDDIIIINNNNHEPIVIQESQEQQQKKHETDIHPTSSSSSSSSDANESNDVENQISIGHTAKQVTTPEDRGTTRRCLSSSSVYNYYMMFGVIVMVISLVIILATIIMKYHHNGDDNGNQNATVANPSDNGNVIDTKLSTMQQVIYDTITSMSMNLTLLQEKASPQNRGLEWMLYNDTYFRSLRDRIQLLDLDDQIRRSIIIQRYALVVFYFSTTSLSTSNKTNSVNDNNVTLPTSIWLNRTMNGWLSSDRHECSRSPSNNTNRTFWYGLNCNADNQVQTIWLDGVGLVGTLPDEIGYLTSLEYLMLNGNDQLTGTIPVTISLLTSLQHLVLSNNHLDGTIPNDVAIPNITFMNLQNNSLYGTIPPKMISSALFSLETLLLSHNKLYGSFPFNMITKGTKLVYLALDNNKFNSTIGTEIGMLSALQYLYVDHNEFYGMIPTEMNQLVHLQTLMVDNNQLSGTIPNSILSSCVELTYLSMVSNNISGTIPEEMNQLLQLQTLNIASNQLSGSLPDLSSLDRLEFMVLSNNRLNGSINLAGMDSLEVAVFSSNEFSGTFPSLSNHSLPKLRGLYLSNNQLTGSIIPMKGRRSVNATNAIDSDVGTICEQTQLQAIYIDENKLNGTIPSCLSQLTDLQQLILSGNQLSGTVPSQLGTLQHLNGLRMEYNHLIGLVPEQVCWLSNADDTLLLSADCDMSHMTRFHNDDIVSIGGHGSLSNHGIICSCCTICCSQVSGCDTVKQ